MKDFIEQITVVDIVSFVVALVAFIKAVEYIIRGVSNNLLNMVRKSIEPINRRLDDISNDLNTLDKEQCKNYLIQCFHEDRKLSEFEKQRVHEVYQHYRDLGGNSYIKEEFERLQDEGKF